MKRIGQKQLSLLLCLVLLFTMAIPAGAEPVIILTTLMFQQPPWAAELCGLKWTLLPPV